MPFANEYVVSAHPPLPLHPMVPRPWALATYSTLSMVSPLHPVLTKNTSMLYHNAVPSVVLEPVRQVRPTVAEPKFDAKEMALAVHSK